MAELVPEAELGLPSGFRGYRVGREGAPPRRAAALNRRPASVTSDSTPTVQLLSELTQALSPCIQPGWWLAMFKRQQCHEPVYCIVYCMSAAVRIDVSIQHRSPAGQHTARCRSVSAKAVTMC